MINKKTLPTFGEAWYEQKESITFNGKKLYSVKRLSRSNPRMSRDEANKYYTKKCKEAFVELGIIKKKVKAGFELRLQGTITTVRDQTEIMLKREARKINRILHVGVRDAE